MEKNCLVTTYKATVNDNSLLKVGEMFIDIIEQASPTNQTNRLYLNTNNVDDLVVEVENGEANLTLDEGMASGWTNKITLPKSVSAPAPVFVRNGNYRLKVLSKYNLTEVGRYTTSIKQKAISVDVKYLKYSSNLVNLLVGLSGNLANISGCTKLNKISNLGSSPNLTGSLSDLAPLTALTSLTLYGSGVTGDIASLAPLTALTKLMLVETSVSGNIKDLRCPLTVMAVYQSNVIGELIEFVKAQRSAGRTTGSCSNGGWWGSYITFNGVNPGGGAQTLTWTENTITNNGVTVNQ